MSKSIICLWLSLAVGLCTYEQQQLRNAQREILNEIRSLKAQVQRLESRNQLQNVITEMKLDLFREMKNVACGTNTGTSFQHSRRQDHVANSALPNADQIYLIDHRRPFIQTFRPTNSHYERPVNGLNDTIWQNPRKDIAAVFWRGVNSGHIYLIGGQEQSGAKADSKQVDRYNPYTQVWSRGPDLNSARRFATAAVLNDRIYVCGCGYANTNNCQTTCETLTGDGQQWRTSLSSDTVCMKLVTSVVIGHKLYLMGGACDGARNHLNIWNSQTEEWSRGTDLLTDRWEGQSAAMLTRTHMLLCGGHHGKEATDTCSIYNVVTDEWTAASTMAEARVKVQMATINGKVYVFGGSTPTSHTNRIEVYHPNTRMWSTELNANLHATGHLQAAIPVSRAV